jgi:hypothetical protein
VVLALGGLIAVGALDKNAPPSDGVAAALVSAAPAATVRLPTARPSRQPRASIVPGGPGNSVLLLDVRPAGSHLFVHGDVFSLAVTRVAVTIEDAAGHVAQAKAVDLPGGSTAFRLGAVPRFDVHFFLPDEIQADGFIVSATALDAGGHDLATLQQLVGRAPESM